MVKNDPITCTINANSTVTCSGSVAGLGNQPVTAEVKVKSACKTRGGGTEPNGHVKGTSNPIDPRNGRIRFSVTTVAATCPPGLIPVLGDTAVVSICSANGVLLFRKTVDIT